ncbi:MAG: HNH endonuclease [Pseudobdellovibrionaceae bacterium]
MERLDLNLSGIANSQEELAKASNQKVIQGLEKLVPSERKVTHLVLLHINEAELRSLYLELGYPSLYKYLTHGLGYAENAAYDRIHAAQVLKKSPSLYSKLEEGSLNLSQLVKVEQSLKQEEKAGKALSPEGTEELLAKIENKTLFETKQILACELDQAPVLHQKIKPQKEGSVRLELTLNQEQYESLKKAQSLISHSVPNNNLSEAITYLAEAYIKKVEGSRKKSESQKEKVRKSKAQETRVQESKTQETTGGNSDSQYVAEAPNLTQDFTEKPLSQTSSLKSSKTKIQTYKTLKQKRKYLSIKTRREVFQKAQHCCEYLDPISGERCNSRFQLQIDHVTPLACGGTDEISNLRVLCGVCNRQEAQRWGLHRRH